MDAHFSSGGSPEDFDPGVDIAVMDAEDEELHTAAMRLILTTTPLQ
jgi:hypothetical protein